jgi:hypothetical protein
VAIISSSSLSVGAACFCKMTMRNLQKNLESQFNELAWSLWTELGVPGVVNFHGDCAVDPEALIAFCNSLDQLDPRLRDVSDIWVQRYGRYITLSRLRSLKKKYSQILMQEPAAAVRKSRVKHNLHSLRYDKHINLDLGKPSLILLRCRAVFGVSSRADILTYLGGVAERRVTASYLANRVSLTKLNVAQVLNDLCSGRVCTVEKDKNIGMYHLQRFDELRGLVAPWPNKQPNWHNIFFLLLTLQQLAKISFGQSSGVASIEAHKALSSFLSKSKQDAMAVPSLSPNDLESYWNRIVDWCITTSTEIANGTSPLLVDL